MGEQIIVGVIGAAVWSVVVYVSKVIYEKITDYKIIVVKKKTWDSFQKVAPNLEKTLRNKS